MSSCEVETILVVCADPEKAAEILQRLHDGGANAVGPVSTAGLALALAAQVTPRSAILAGETTGRRRADDLARELTTLWGVDCYVLPPTGGSELDEPIADDLRAPVLREVLRDNALRPAVVH